MATKRCVHVQDTVVFLDVSKTQLLESIDAESMDLDGQLYVGYFGLIKAQYLK